MKKYLFLIIAALLIMPAPTRAAECSVETGQTYKTRTSPSVYYVSRDCKKRPILNRHVFFSYFDSWNDVNLIDGATLRSIPDHELGFLPWGPKRDYPNASLLKTTSDSRVYLLYGDLRPISSEEAFRSLGLKFTWVEDVAPEVIERFDVGEPITVDTGYPEHFIFKYPDSAFVYRLEKRADGTLQPRLIPTEADFRNRHYRFDRIVVLPRTVEFTDRLPDVRVFNGMAEEEESSPEANAVESTPTPTPAPAPSSGPVFDGGTPVIPEVEEYEATCTDITDGDGSHALCVGDRFTHQDVTFSFEASDVGVTRGTIGITQTPSSGNLRVAPTVTIDSKEKAILDIGGQTIYIRYRGLNIGGEGVFTVSRK